MTSDKRNLNKMLMQADDTDMTEGALAYQRYNHVMRKFAAAYDTTPEIATAVFCALSPNNDYLGNLRSMASVLQGVQQGARCNDIVVSTYNHCRNRAYRYAKGDIAFLDCAKGPKIRAFYHNLTNPHCGKHVTIDGHMKAAYVGEILTMKQALIRGKIEYNAIADAVHELAYAWGLLSNQIQAIIWFTRKRTLNIKYNAQLDLFGDATDKWQTLKQVSDAPPYSRGN